MSALSQPYCINYNSKDGLPDDKITALAEDQDGYIFIGTATGIIFFDGIEFQNIGKIGFGDLPKEVFVEEIVFDKQNNLWMRTERNGIYHLDKEKNRWYNFSQKSESNRNIINNEIKGFEIYGDELLYTCLGCGIHKIDIGNLTTTGKFLASNSNTINLFEGKSEKLIITNYDVISLKNKASAAITDTLFEGSTFYSFTTAIESQNQDIWLTSYTMGLFLLSKGKLINKPPPPGLDTWRYKLIGQQKDKIWFTVRNYGVASIDINTNKWTVYTSQPFDRNSLPKGKYNGGIIDSRGIIWVATSKGLSCIDPNLQGFENFDNQNEINEYLLDAQYDKKTEQYIMTYTSEEDKIKVFDKTFKQVYSSNHTPNIEYVQSIRRLLPYDNDYIAIGHKIKRIDSKTGKISNLNLPVLKDIVSPKDIMIDNEGYLWVCLKDNKLLKYDLIKKKKVLEVKIQLPSANQDVSFSMRGLSDCGAYIGVVLHSIFILVDKTGNNTYTYDVDLPSKKITKIDTNLGSSGTINQLVWYNDFLYILSKNEGIYQSKLDPLTKEIKIINMLSPEGLYGPVEMDWDDEDNIWVATDNGLAVMDKDLNLNKIFKLGGGLKKTKLSEGLSITNNKIILNGENGFIVGNREILLKNTEVVAPDIYVATLSGIGIDNIQEKLSVSYEKRDLQVNITIPTYGDLNNYQFAHRLIPHNSEWIIGDVSNHQFRYDRLLPENYTFEVKSISGNRESEIKSFSFTINPPFWKTWWFLLVSVIILLLILYLIYKVRLRNKVNKEKLNTRIAQLKNEAIRAQLNPHFIFNALNSIRSLILMDKKEASISYLGNFSSLVRDILNISKEESITLAKEIEFNKRYVEIERLRFSETLLFKINIAESLNPAKIKVPPMLLQPFIENAIWHGLIGKEGKAELNIDIRIVEKELRIEIDDNGLGRNQKKGDSSFSKTRKGYGELLSRERLNNARIGASIQILDKTHNNQPTGTTVIITLPMES